MIEFISLNLFFLLILVAIGMFIILRIKVHKSTKQDKEEIELLKRRVEELERNK
jgi:hypothetical protein